MTPATRIRVLRANALFLTVAAAGGLVADLLGAFLARGPWAPVLAQAPHAAIGFVEAHGLALIFGVLLWIVQSSRQWHLTAAAVHALLGTANLVFWNVFIAADALVVGYATTALHFAFVALQLTAAREPRII